MANGPHQQIEALVTLERSGVENHFLPAELPALSQLIARGLRRERSSIDAICHDVYFVGPAGSRLQLRLEQIADRHDCVGA